MSGHNNYAVVTLAYWGFTLTDGALRMLVLLYFHARGYGPLDLAFLFLAYEAMGIITNFAGGWVGTRYGLRSTFYGGLLLQIIALLTLSGLKDNWGLVFSVIYIMGAQALSGMAKDLIKMSAKSAVKLLVSGANDAKNPLFRWIAFLTGSKNALKGLGFFMGGFLLQFTGFDISLWIMAAGLSAILTFCLISLKQEIGKAKHKIRVHELLARDPAINLLSLARVFLFASRDVWFVVALPIFLYSGPGWRFDEIGGFMALWVIGYGFTQALAPKILHKIPNAAAGARSARNWAWILGLVMIFLIIALEVGGYSSLILLTGLMIFGIVFAFNSALHSYLIVDYAENDRIALSVGFYYAANALGRFVGTLFSGLGFLLGGLQTSLVASAFMVLISAVVMVFLARMQA